MTQIAFVAYPGFTGLDMIGPYEVLRNLPGAEVRFVWHEPGPITADSGVLLIAATHSLSETSSPDIILVPGGPSTPVHAHDEVLLDWLRAAHRTASWKASVCSGSVILGAARPARGPAGDVALAGHPHAEGFRRHSGQRRASGAPRQRRHERRSVGGPRPGVLAGR
ncbi:DJ-1/PfpI family protein [Mycobacterium genavense]|uniref:DJ-1/PfpI family protein n=1 Tax=Mycobacterium genavense TaxID=36812 RepID=UPI0004AF29E7|nr:DJ-1/PfpI family protein [Mycobacterium genavense]